MPGIYATDGSMNVTVIDGISSARGVYAADGSRNIALFSKTTGAYHPNGAWNTTMVSGSWTNTLRAQDGSMNISVSPYVDGTQKVTRVGGNQLPSFIFDFTVPGAETKWTVSRASVGLADDLSGNWVSFPANTMRRTNKGALIEEPRINIIANNTTMVTGSGQNWSPFGPNTMVASTDVAGIIPGAVEMKHTRDTTTGDTNVGSVSTITGASNTTYVASAFIFVPISYGASITLTVEGASPFGTGNSIIVGYDISKRGRWQRISSSITSGASGSGTAAIVLRMPSANTGDSIYSTGWQFEATGGPVHPTSPIMTTTGSVARAAENISMLSAGIYNASSSTLFAEAMNPYDSATSTFPGTFGVNDGTNSNRMEIEARTVDDTVRNGGISGGVGQGSIGTGQPGYGSFYKLAGTFAANDVAISLNGNSAVTSSTWTMPTGISQFQLGALSPNNNSMNGYIKRVAYWPNRLTNAQLQVITT